MKKNRAFFLLGLFLMAITTLPSCQEYTVMPEKGSVNFKIYYESEGVPLEFDSLKYVNTAGNEYSVNKIHYYISGISFHHSNGSIYSVDDIHYIDAEKPETNTFNVTDIPLGTYNKITFNIGLASALNISNSLPATTDNVFMAWPDGMGGGYHFLKLEGYFKDSLGIQFGYAMHIGNNACLVNAEINHTFTITYQNQRLNLYMDVNRWFDTPNVFDIETNNYTMGDMTAMMQLASNGHNVFSIK